ncbi:minor head protein-like [Alphaproteobacteria phage PhiJL001]|uniref:Minor head protein-like n=1 Tax=Alphaproteobacteria phage PhiJL001 TaxID=2681607 RepID=Q5DN43_9CAUD|nr:head morphogenesis [Alphaproteobacteria phage PhiJL001]AAT69538.1 minor head protein-like [Alphaproteobacteria phage PhiJL001]
MPTDDQIPGMPDNVNEEWLDAMIRHQIGLLRVSGRVRQRIFEILDATERDIADQIKRRLAKGATTARLEALIKAVRALRSEAWKKSAEVWREEMLSVAREEPKFLSQALRTVSPVQLDLTLPAADLLQSIVTTRPFEGQTMRQWASNIRNSDLRRIERAIRIGVTQGEPTNAIARRVIGTVRQRGRDGVTQITRRNAEAITRTAINGIANQAKREFYKANATLFEEEIYVATLDSRTTPICRSLDGQRFAIGEGPIPPLHFNCRSLRVAAIDGDAIGSRPQRQFTQRQLLREYARSRGIKAPTRRADLPRGHKGEFDSFARTRIRQLTGTVDAKVSYQDWLTRQSTEFQDDVLGKTRARLFRKGGLRLDRFVNRQGDEIPLADLARRETSAFRAAGLDPEDFT